MRFAHLKVHHRFERMRLRGLSGARDEFLLAATVQNLKNWRSESPVHHPPASAYRLPEVCVMTTVASASRSPPIKRPQNTRLISAGSKLPKQHNAAEEPIFQRYRPLSSLC